MAYRKIEKKFDERQIISEIYTHIMCDPEIGDKTVQKIADAMDRKRPTIYSYFYGQSKPPILDFLHACAIATDGDPAIKKYLEPEGFSLSKIMCSQPDKSTIFEELLDDVSALSMFQEVLREPGSTKLEVDRALEKVVRELNESVCKFKQNRK